MLKIVKFRGYKYLEIGDMCGFALVGYYLNSTPEEFGFSEKEGEEGVYAKRIFDDEYGDETIRVAVYIEGWLAVETTAFDALETQQLPHDYFPFSCAVFGATEADAHAEYNAWMESL